MGPIKKVERLRNRVEVHYHLRQPYGEKDKDGMKKVLYRNVENLPSPPEISEHRTDANWEELIDIDLPEVGRTICFRYTSMRSGGGPPEEGLDGPYLREERSEKEDHDPLSSRSSRFRSDTEHPTREGPYERPDGH